MLLLQSSEGPPLLLSFERENVRVILYRFSFPSGYTR